MGTAITSTANPRVKQVVALHRRRGRREQGRYLVEGPHAVAEALADGVVVEVYATSGLAPDYRGVTVPVVEVADHVLAKLATSVSPQGVVAVAEPATSELTQVTGRGLLVVLHAAADPGNVGAILRTADAAGASAVVVTSGSADPFGPKSVRAAAGSTTHLPLVTDVAVSDVLAACRSAGQATIALDAGADEDLFDVLEGRGTRPIALVLGSEAHGLPPEVRAGVDVVAAIPIRGRAESFNLAAAAAIAAYAAATPRLGLPEQGRSAGCW